MTMEKLSELMGYRYNYVEQKFRAGVNGNPFDVDFQIRIICPDQSVKQIHGFYDGEDIFRFRFYLEKTGKYEYQTKCKVPELNGINGAFWCKEKEGMSENQSKNQNHGMVRVKDKYWFEYEDHTPFFEAGTTCYAWIHQTQDLQRQTLDTLSSGYFNKLRMCIFPKWYEYNHRQPALFPMVGNTRDEINYDIFNTEFFKHLDQQIISLGKMGIEADLILFHPYDCTEWGFSNMSRQQDIRYLRYVVARYSCFHNVWWSLANEYDLFRNGYKRKVSAWKKLIQYVHDEDPYGHLLSIHQLTKMYDHRDKNITHCSIQRTELFMTSEYTDTWIKQYEKPVVIDECVYEGNLNSWWGGITPQEMVRRFWEATARGGYMGHGETYMAKDKNIWWSHGGQLYGESAPRIQFLKQIMEECPNICFSSGAGTNNLARGIAKLDAQILYLGYFQPLKQEIHLLGSGTYKIIVIDTWNMTKKEIEGEHSGHVTIPLPGKPYMAILAIAISPRKIQPFSRDSVFEEMAFYPGGKKLLCFLNKIVPQFYGGILSMTINQCSAAAGGILDGRAGEGMLIIVNENRFLKGLWMLLSGVILSILRKR